MGTKEKEREGRRGGRYGNSKYTTEGRCVRKRRRGKKEL